MSFLLLLACGFLGGILGGMGMGGGTVLIPLLTIVCGIEQPCAQAINLLAFVPMAAAALTLHARNGLLQKKGLLSFVIPAALLSALGAFVAAQLPSRVLSKIFGIFLIILSIFWFKNSFIKKK